ncbi:hypothetical protein ZOSMA_43G00800 [Zostera marina]|uniref:Uncharacterized protein n=1 Tax=Zostera marina TaxID=29655 RepID=A0A0K9P1N3_ZOSMR|nr:hypothetical protein ZOSMA_43G00800 [Zostera marina]
MKMKDKGFSNNSKNHLSQGATNYQAAGRSTNHSVQNSINVVSDVEMPPLEQIPLSLRVHFGLTDEVESNPANNDLKNEDLVLSDSENGQIEIESFTEIFRLQEDCFDDVTDYDSIFHIPMPSTGAKSFYHQISKSFHPGGY